MVKHEHTLFLLAERSHSSKLNIHTACLKLANKRVGIAWKSVLLFFFGSLVIRISISCSIFMWPKERSFDCRSIRSLDSFVWLVVVFFSSSSSAGLLAWSEHLMHAYKRATLTYIHTHWDVCECMHTAQPFFYHCISGHFSKNTSGIHTNSLCELTHSQLAFSALFPLFVSFFLHGRSFRFGTK